MVPGAAGRIPRAEVARYRLPEGIEYSLIYRGQEVLAVVDFGSFPTHLPSVHSTGDTQED